MIYFDNAATSIDKDKRVARAVYDAIISKEYANPSRGVYPKSLNSLKKLLEIRTRIANYFGLDNPLDVVLSPNVTYSLNFIINSLFDENDHVITSLAEHNSVLRPLYNLERKGMGLSFIDFDQNFNLNIDKIDELIQKNTKAIIVTAASNISGKISDLEKIHQIAKKHKLILIIDGAQLAGVVDFKLTNFENTIFAFTGHKSLHGPQGTGGFLTNGDFNFKQVFSGGSGFDSFSKTQPNVLPDLFEIGTANLHSFVGLEEAIKIIEENPPYQKLEEFTRLLYNKLKENDRLEFYTKLEEKNAPIVSINIRGFNANDIGQILWDEYGICVRCGSHCAPLFHKHVNTEKKSIVRFSLSSYNTKEEIYKLVDAIDEISKQKNLL